MINRNLFTDVDRPRKRDIVYAMLFGIVLGLLLAGVPFYRW